MFWKFQFVGYILSLRINVHLNVDYGFSTSQTGNLHVVQGEALVRSSFWKEPHACTMEKVSALQLSSLIFSSYLRNVDEFP